MLCVFLEQDYFKTLCHSFVLGRDFFINQIRDAFANMSWLGIPQICHDAIAGLAVLGSI